MNIRNLVLKATGNDSEGFLSSQFILITAIAFLYFFNFHSMLLLPLRIQDLGGEAVDIGMIMGVSGFSTLFSTPIAGILADKYGKRINIIIGILLLSISTISLVKLNQLGFSFYLIRIIQGVSFSLFFISLGTLIADITPDENRTQALGLYGVFTIINYALSPYVGKILIEHYDFNTFFIFFTVIGLLSFPLSLLIKEESYIKETVEHDSSFKGFISILVRNQVYILALTLFLSGYAFIAALNFLPVYIIEIKVYSFDLFFISYTLSTLLVRIFGGWIPDKYGRLEISKPSILLFSISLLVLGVTNNLSVLILSGIFFGISHGFAYPSIYSLVIDRTTKVLRAKAFAICSFAFTSGGMLGSFNSGIIANYLGYRIMYLQLAIVVFIGFFIFILFSSNNTKRTF